LNIQLNDQPLDVTIAETETLGEVVRDLESWLTGTDLVLYSVRHQDRELLSRPEEEWAAIPQGQVDTLRVTVRPVRELVALNLQTVNEYLDLLTANLPPGGETVPPPHSPAVVPQALLDGYPAMAESLAQHFPDSRPALQALEALLRSPEGELQDPVGGQATALIERLRSRVSLRLGELADPQEALRMLAPSLDRCIEEISEVSILLQTGRNRQAMEVMTRFSEVSQDLIRVISRDLGDCPVEGKALPEFYKELNGILAELIEAFRVRDSVLIGDLMEYEVAPRLQALRSFLHQHGAVS
jgi:hypothetical protein